MLYTLFSFSKAPSSYVLRVHVLDVRTLYASLYCLSLHTHTHTHTVVICAFTTHKAPQGSLDIKMARKYSKARQPNPIRKNSDSDSKCGDAARNKDRDEAEACFIKFTARKDQ